MSKYVIVKHCSPLTKPIFTVHKVKFLFFKGQPLQLFSVTTDARKKGYNFEKIKNDGFVTDVSKFFLSFSSRKTTSVAVLEETIQYYTALEAYDKLNRKVLKSPTTLAEIRLSNLLDGE